MNPGARRSTLTSFDRIVVVFNPHSTGDAPRLAEELGADATLSETGTPDDGRFEVVTLPHTAKWRVLGVAIRAAIRGLGPQPTAERYAFTTLTPMPLQLDGELLTLDARTPVLVEIAPRALTTLG